jgi:hypothetical chaperone protein
LAAAHDLHQQRQTTHAAQTVLICDFGGGTCDFSVLQLAGQAATKLQPSAILAHHGIHVAGTDFDRQVSLACIMPLLGYQSINTAGREMPSRIYHDLATWHLINPCYAPARVLEQRGQRSSFTNPLQHERLMRVLSERLGHALAQAAEAAKIQAAEQGEVISALPLLDAQAQLHLTAQTMAHALQTDVQRIANAAQEAVRRAQLKPSDVGLLYFTGGSSRLQLLSSALAQVFPNAQSQFGDSFASVAKGLGVLAQQQA